MSKEYVKLKVKNCQRLVDNATSEAQKEIYQIYLDQWTKKLPAKERPEAIAKREDAKVKKEAEAAAKAFELKKQAEERAKEEAEKLKAAKIKAEKIAAKKAELVALEAEEAEILKIIEVPKPVRSPVDIEFEQNLANLFEEQNPGKKAYRTQNGDKIKTIAFKEYLNPKTE